LNRNWDFDWGGNIRKTYLILKKSKIDFYNINSYEAFNGSSKDPCSEIYCGAFPFSEVEAKGVADFLLKNNEKIISTISLHSYSQLWLSPWSTLDELPIDFELQVNS
jgi:hypothetical protein